MAIATEKSRRFLAVGEYIDTDSSAMISIFDLKNGAYFKRMRQVGYSDSKINEFSCLSFSYDSKFLAASSGSGDLLAIIWDWYRDKLIAKCSFPISLSKISFNPKDPYLICTTGQGLWKNWKIDEKSFKPQPPFSGMDRSKNYIDHCWLDDEILVSITLSGEAYIARSTDYLNVIDTPFFKNNEKKSEVRPTCVICTSNFIYFGSNEGTIAMWQKSTKASAAKSGERKVSVIMQNSPQGDICNFEFVRIWSTLRNFPITSLTFSQNEEVMGFSLNNNDIGVCNVSKAMHEELEVRVEIYCQGFHKGPITAMDVAVQRPLLVTCSQSDCSVRVWNYTNFRCEIAYKLKHDNDSGSSEAINRSILSVAFHPSGYYLSVGFEDKVRIYHVLFDQIRLFRELSIKNSTSMRFSNGGHFLAASSNKFVYIYTAFTLEQVQVFKSFSQPVLDLAWTSSDLKIVVVGTDGVIYFCDLNSETEHLSKSTEFSSVTLAENDMVVACGIDSQVSVLMEQLAFDWKVYSVGLRPRLSQVHYFKSYHGTGCFISGCHSGNIQLYGPTPSNAIIEEIVAHSGKITRLRSSYDGRYVFSGGEDGVIFIYHVIEPRDLQPQIEKLDAQVKEELLIRNVDEKLADIVLIQKTTLDNFKSQLESNRQAMENIRQKRDYSLQQQEYAFEERRKELEKELHNEYKALESQYDRIRDEKMRKEREWVERLSNLERAHKSAIESAESLYEKKLALEDEKFRKLDKEKQELKQYYEEQIAVLQRQNEEAIENLAIAFKESLKKTQEDYEETRTTAENLKLDYEERLSMQEDEHESEILDLKKKFERQVEEQTTENTALRRKNEALTTEQQMFSEEKESLRIKGDKKLSTIEKLDKTKNDLMSQVRSLENDKTDKENLLIEKEKKIYEFKNEIKKLDKQKHVQDARKKEILEELLPKDEEITKLQQEMQKIHNDCDKERTKNNELKKNIKEREDMIGKLKEEAKIIHSQAENRERSLRSITNDIYNTVNNIEQKDWPSELDTLFEKYVKSEISKVSKKDPECIDEMEEQLKYMQKSIEFMKQAQDQVLYRSKSDLKKRTDENSTLIQELHELRTIKNSNGVTISELEYKLNNYIRTFNANEGGKKKGTSKQASNSNLPSINPAPLPVPRPNSGMPIKGVPKGKLYRGSPFESKLVNIQEKQRIGELEKDLSEKKEENYFLKIEINNLRDALSKIEEDPQED